MARPKIEKLMKNLNRFVLLAIVLLSFTLSSTLVQAQPLPGKDVEQVSGTRKQLATIIFAGLAGAILGLSTLSFYGRPQDKLSNIAIGFAVGIIVGASYTTYKAATQPYNYLDNTTYDINLDPRLRVASELEQSLAPAHMGQPEYGLAYNWNF